jgi:hypothetical protein
VEEMLAWSWRNERTLYSGSGSEKFLQAVLTEVVKAVMRQYDSDVS